MGNEMIGVGSFQKLDSFNEVISHISQYQAARGYGPENSRKWAQNLPANNANGIQRNFSN